MTAAFNARTTTGTGPLVYTWTYGDGGTGTGVNPNHTYASRGIYTVVLTVTGPGGSDTETQQVTVAVPAVAPIAGFTHTSTGLAPNFDASVTTSTGPLVYAWTYGDGGTGTGAARRSTRTPRAAATPWS